MRSVVPGHPAHVLRLFEDSPRYEIERLRGRLALDQRRTEVVVSGMHRSALATLTARRIADYLGSELRGQILGRGVEILVYDRIARGRAPKVLEVIPRRFEGERLPLPEEVATDGFSHVRVELYVTPAESQQGARVSVACAGTVVYDDITQVELADLQREPWTDLRLAGLFDFPDFQVPPGTRRGVMPDRAALAFIGAIRRLEPEIRGYLTALDQRVAAEVDATVMRQLERAFREVSRLAPEYDFFAVRSSEAELPQRSPPTSNGDGRGSHLAVSDYEPPAGVAIAEAATRCLRRKVRSCHSPARSPRPRSLRQQRESSVWASAACTRSPAMRTDL